MRLYEAVVILNAHSSEEQLRGCAAKIGEVLTKHEAKLVKKTDWGRRPLGFPIQKQSDGFFLVLEFEANPNKVAEIQHAFRLADFILYSTIFVKAKAKAAPEHEKVPA